MAENLKGYIALITGGSSGMGFEMAKQLLSQGATVIITARGGSKLDSAKESLSAFGDVHAAAMDVMSEASIGEVPGTSPDSHTVYAKYLRPEKVEA